MTQVAWNKNLSKIDKDKLIYFYYDKKYTQKKTAKELGVSQALISLYLKKNKMSIRSRSEAESGELNPFFGKHHSEKSKRKISIANKGRNTGADSWNWQGGIRKGHDGGYLRYTDGSYIHRGEMEKFLGRKLNSEELVHHINGNVTDNRIENLKIMSNKEHSTYHRKKEREEKCQKK